MLELLYKGYALHLLSKKKVRRRSSETTQHETAGVSPLISHFVRRRTGRNGFPLLPEQRTSIRLITMFLTLRCARVSCQAFRDI